MNLYIDSEIAIIGPSTLVHAHGCAEFQHIDIHI